MFKDVTGTVVIQRAVCSYIDALVHPDARRDAATAARHRAFIAPRLIGSCAVLAGVPIYLAFRAMPTALEVGILGWLIAPMLVAVFLSRTGRYETATVLSSLALTGLVTFVAWRTGGLASFAAAWLILVPLEAALSASRRVVAVAAAFAITAVGVLLLAGPGLMSFAQNATADGAVTAAGIASGTLGAAGVALGSTSLFSLSVRKRA